MVVRSWVCGAILAAGVAPAYGAPSPAAPPAASVHFQVIDETDPQEISEDTVIFLNGVQVAHFKTGSYACL